LLIFLLIFNASHLAKSFYPLLYRDIIFQYAQEYNIDPYLIAAIIKAESNFNPWAVSPKGARGLMQVMPQTGEWVAKETGQVDFHQEQLFRPEINIRLGSWYLANLYQEFQGDLILVLAAYNSGQGNVKKWQSEKHWTQIRKIGQVPFPETKQFIRKVIWNYRVYKYLYA
jgi:soluble lytic murein transglycosylase